MKKGFCFLLVILITLSFCSCKTELIVYKEGKCHLILPASKTEIEVKEFEAYINKIDNDLLKKAEKTITDKVFPQTPEFSLIIDNENYLCLSSQEFIVEINPPKDPYIEGCGYDHDHVWYTERISKEPVK